MNAYNFDIKELFDTYIKATQYIMRQTFNHDEYTHFSGVAINFFKADVVAFYIDGDNEELSLFECNNTDPEFRKKLTEVCSDSLQTVQDSDFISVDSFEVMSERTFSTIIMPLHISKPATIVVVGYETEQPLSKDLLNLYLSLMAMFETVQIRSKEIEARALAERDSLTKLYNKIATEKHIDEFLKIHGAFGKHAMIMFDIDNFKKLNDNYGHIEGDKVLTELAETLLHTSRDTDIVGRIGGDEFVIFMKNYNNIEKISTRMKAVMNTFARRYEHENATFTISLSVGIGLYGQDGLSFKELYINSDKAMYKAKRSGKNRISFCQSDINFL